MRRPAAQPNFSFFVRIDPETDKRRRRLQRELGCTACELVERALRSLEASVSDASSVPARAVARRSDPLWLKCETPPRLATGVRRLIIRTGRSTPS
jgi:hypothetical protein